MKAINNQYLNKQVMTVAMIGIILLFSGCKKNDDEVNTGYIESKLSNDSSQEWSTKIYFSSDTCVGPSTGSTILFKSNHQFTYNGNCTFTGYWNAEYSANRSGQFLLVNFNYMKGTENITESFSLKYSSDQDIFYALDPATLKLYPFEKYNLAP